MRENVKVNIGPELYWAAFFHPSMVTLKHSGSQSEF